MIKTYRLAIQGPYALTQFGPVMTLDQAEYYREEMERGGKSVLIVNTDSQ